MSRKIIFLLVFLGFFVNSYPQPFTKYFWQQIPSPVSYNLNSFVDKYVVGDNGTLLITNNYGYSFIKYNGLSVNNNLNAINFLFPNNMITIAGDNGIIFYMHTNEWNQQNSGTTSNLNGVSGGWNNYPALVFWRVAVGENGTIIRSTNSSGSNWANWYPVTSPATQNLNSIITKEYSGWIAGDNGTLLKSTNRGENWFLINTGLSNNFNCILFTDTLTGWITGSNGLIMKSTNGGLNWAIKPSGTTSDLKTFLLYATAGSNGTLLRSTDTGESWYSEDIGTNKTINSFYCSLTSNNFFSIPIVVCDSGLIMRRVIDSSYLLKKLEGNTIRTCFSYRGIFNNNTQFTNTPGFEWQINSNKYAIFTTGLSISAIVNGELRQAMCSYLGEYEPGYCSSGIPHTNDTFKIYSVKHGDSHISNPDWLYWGLMVPYGAPYIDVNNNNQYEPMLDTPGVKNASQTIFMCLTDGFPSSHSPGESFGGGTAPLFAETHITAWCYSQPSYNQMQFIKLETINKGINQWSKTYYSVFCDSEVGSADDDYVGCDTIRKMGYGYNADNDDPVYGLMPPAVGIILLKGTIQKYSSPSVNLGMTSFLKIGKNWGPPCESMPTGEPYPAYLMMKGYKKDSTSFIDISQTPYKRTKFCFSGDPETNTGWTEYKGYMINCGGDTTGQLTIPSPPGDKYFLMSSGSDLNTVMPGDTQTIVICQLIARGNSNLNSVTKLKELADVAINFYNTGFIIGIEKIVSEIPTEYGISQNYPNPFNSTTNVKFQMLNTGRVKLAIYDLIGREVANLINNENISAGIYTYTFDGNNLASGVYFLRILVNDGKDFSDVKKIVLLK
jgi:hypothetical protein